MMYDSDIFFTDEVITYLNILYVYIESYRHEIDNKTVLEKC